MQGRSSTVFANASHKPIFRRLVLGFCLLAFLLVGFSHHLAAEHYGLATKHAVVLMDDGPDGDDGGSVVLAHGSQCCCACMAFVAPEFGCLGLPNDPAATEIAAISDARDGEAATREPPPPKSLT